MKWDTRTHVDERCQVHRASAVKGGLEIKLISVGLQVRHSDLGIEITGTEIPSEMHEMSQL
jgi:hypothetical protein